MSYYNNLGNGGECAECGCMLEPFEVERSSRPYRCDQCHDNERAGAQETAKHPSPECWCLGCDEYYYGGCDVCGKRCLLEELHTFYTYGIETTACEACRNQGGK